MDDLEFVQKCVQGDRQSWKEFVDKYSRLIYNYIHSVSRIKGSPLTQENINDIFQEIFLSLVANNFRKLKSFKAKNGCSLASWLRQVSINAAIDCMRKIKPAIISLDEENDSDTGIKDTLADRAPLVTSQLLQEEKLVHLKDCVEKLDTRDKYFLELYINKGVSLEELRQILKVSRGSVDMRKSRIIDKLRDCFKGKGFMLDF